MLNRIKRSSSAFLNPLRGRLMIAAAAGAVLSGAALGRQAGGDAEKQPVQTMLIVERAALSDLLPSPKDAALVKAIEMLPARLHDLRKEIPEMRELPPEAIDLLTGLMARPARLAITNKGFDQQTGMPGIGAVLSWDMQGGGEDAAKAMHARVERLRTISQMPFEPSPSKRFQGMTDLPLPMGVVSYGPRKGAGGWRYEIIFAAIDDPDAAFAALPEAPEGLRPVVRGKIDLAAWSPLIQMFAGFAAMASPEGQAVIEQLRSAGIIGPEAMSGEFVHGFRGDAAGGRAIVRKLGRYAEAYTMSRAVVTDEDLSAIPVDASLAVMKSIDLNAQWQKMEAQIKSMSASGGPPAMEIFEKMREILGVDLKTDVFDAIGDKSGMYFADSTGGSSIFSFVGLLSVKDVPKLTATLEKIAVKLTGKLREELPPPARVEIARFERDGIVFMQLRFPGLPVPIEPTIAVAGKWMVVGGTPQAALAAARHIRTAKSGLPLNEAFAKGRFALPAGAGANMVSFTDSARTLRDGYGAMTIVTSTVANLVRSAGDAEKPREPGFIMPTYTELLEGVRPTVIMSYWQGDDYVFDWRGEPSVLAALSAQMGVGDAIPFISGLGIGGAIGVGAASEIQKNQRLGRLDALEDDEDMMEDEIAPPEEAQAEGEPAKPAKKQPTPY